MINSKNKKRKNVIKAKERNRIKKRKKEYIKIQSNLLILNVPFSSFL